MTEINPLNYKELLNSLWPICRSIVGPGFRDSLKILNEYMPLETESIPTGTNVFDWTIPEEWSIESAWIKDSKGNIIVDFQDNNLHVLNYSISIDRRMSLEELKKNLFTLPDQPNAIPYVTSYYKKRWGFCLSHNQLQALTDDIYHVQIISQHTVGHLNYGSSYLKSTTGESQEILLSTYLCHPSMANNELSGPIAMLMLYQKLAKLKHRRFNYRFVIVPETIGSIAFLSQHGETLKTHCMGGLVLTCCGDRKVLNYKRSRIGNSEFDRISENILSFSNIEIPIKIRDFFPSGSDERQYCSPGFNLPVGSLTKSMYGEYPEYHTSLDNIDFISFEGLKETADIAFEICLGTEINRRYIRPSPHCEPMLSKRNLYPDLGAQKNTAVNTKAISYILAYSDGSHDLLDIANLAKMKIIDLIESIEALKRVELIEEL